MERMKVIELMRSVHEFPRISSNASFMEAVEMLEMADEHFKSGKAPERIVLVYDGKGKIVGKLSPIDVVKALEPNYAFIDTIKFGTYARFVQASLESMKEQYRIWHKPLGELWKKAHNIKIIDFIKMPDLEQMLDVNDSMDIAFHLFVMFRQGSLFVRDRREIVALIRFSDVYKKIRESMRATPEKCCENAAVV